MQADPNPTLSAPTSSATGGARPTRVQTAFAEWARAMNYANDRKISDAQGRIFSAMAESALKLLEQAPSKSLSDVLLKLWAFNYESYQNGGPLLDSIVTELVRFAIKADPGAKAFLGRNLRRAPRERDMSRTLFRVAERKSAEDPARVRECRAELRRLEVAKHRGRVTEWWLRTFVYDGYGVALVGKLTDAQAVEAWSAWRDHIDEKIGPTRMPPGFAAAMHANVAASTPAAGAGTTA